MTPALARKLNFKPGAKLIYVRTLAEVEKKAGPIVALAKADGIAWLAYPKSGKLDTDLNRDILWRHMLKKGLQGVRQVAIDATWSAMRFRPKKAAPR